MRLVIGSDHAGFQLKNSVSAFLKENGHDVVDVGAFNRDPVDYPDFAAPVGHAVLDGRAQRGVLICGSGIGASVAGNKLRGIRAGLCHDTYSAHQGVEHDEMNVIVLGARVIGAALARELAGANVNAGFSGEERHVRRLEKVRALEISGGASTAEPHLKGIS